MYSSLHHPNLSKTEHFVLQVILLTLLPCYKLNRCYIKLSLVNILENVFVFIEILFKILLFKGGVLIYAEHCTCTQYNVNSEKCWLPYDIYLQLSLYLLYI